MGSAWRYPAALTDRYGGLSDMTEHVGSGDWLKLWKSPRDS